MTGSSGTLRESFERGIASVRSIVYEIDQDGDRLCVQPAIFVHP